MNLLNYSTKTLGIFLLISFVISCATVPLTNRSQLNLLPESQMVAMALTTYDEFLKENKLSTNKHQTQMVKRVGAKISKSVENFLKKNNKASLLEDYNWEFNLIQNDTTPNAWCMPGGKVVIYSGILPITKTEAGLAVVMGHEIAHAVARHGNERMSQGLITQFGGLALQVAIQEKPEETQALFMAAYGLGAQVGVMLPYSRLHETEADKMGLIFMAMAGYDPHEAIAFWQRMSKQGGNKPPEFLSTHPGDETRINNLKDYLPEAMKYYKK
ncbi:MAG: peptidase M48 [Marinilabiliales bacterium]|nr:MAG: peptidase M48 [Marinilabiliales bacterium]